MKTSKELDHAVCLLFDILYEKYQPRICYALKVSNNLANKNYYFTLNEEINGDVRINDDQKIERTLCEESSILQINTKRQHQKTKSDVSGIGKKRYL